MEWEVVVAGAFVLVPPGLARRDVLQRCAAHVEVPREVLLPHLDAALLGIRRRIPPCRVAHRPGEGEG